MLIQANSSHRAWASPGGPANNGELDAKKGSRGKLCGGQGLKTGGGGV